jgi:hypothetical protein
VDRQGYSGDITGPYGSAQGGSQCLKMGGVSYVLGLIIFPFNDPDGMPEIPELGQSQVEGEENASSQQEKHKPLVTTQVVVQEKQKFIDFLHAMRIIRMGQSRSVKIAII